MDNTVRVIVQDSVGGYPIPQWYPVVVEKVVNSETELTLNGLKETLLGLNAEWLDFVLDENASYYLIEFPDTLLLEREELIRRYLYGFMGYLLNYWAQRGGDDDYFDYLPSITDVFYQLTKKFNPDLWRTFLKLLVEIEGEEVKTEALYRY